MSEILECGHEESPHSPFTSGYGRDDQGNRHCYACCHARDLAHMAEHGAIVGYLSSNGTTVTNWPGDLLAQVTHSWQTSAGGFARRTMITRLYARAADGSWWAGRGPGRGMYMRLKKLRREPR